MGACHGCQSTNGEQDFSEIQSRPPSKVFCVCEDANVDHGQHESDAIGRSEPQVGGSRPIGNASLTHVVAAKFMTKDGAVEKKFSSRPIGLRLGRDYYNLPTMVKSVHPGGAAEKQGIKEGWELIEANRLPAANTGALALEQLVCGPLDKHFLRLQSLLDVFDDFRSQVPLLKVYFDEHTDFEAKARALAEKAAEIQKKPELFAEFLPNVVSNLKAVEPLLQNTKDVCMLLMKYIDDWKFDTTGEVDSPPALSDETERDMEISQAELNAVHTIAYVHYPPKFHNHSTFLGLTGELSRDLPHSEKPVAIITVGPPGSGKSYMISSEFGCVNWLQTNYNGPSSESYVEIDPDFWITNLCGNDNAYRPLCNMLNLENFFFSVNQRYNLIFGGTGKDIKNTLGRVTARLKQAGYRIYFAIVLSTYENCMKRIQNRFEKTGRNVPDFVVQALFKGLQESVPLYLKRQAQLCDAMMLYENNIMGKKPEPLVLSRGEDPTQIVELAKRILALPPSTEPKNA